jgi:hypothetical protein
MSYEQALNYVHEHTRARPTRNTAARYYKTYVQKIREPAAAVGIPEDEYFNNYFYSQDGRREVVRNERMRNAITYTQHQMARGPDGWLHPADVRLNSEELARQLETWLPALAVREAARIREYGIDAEHLSVTIRYRRAPKKSRKR